jgi:hypothetical protein
MAIDYSLLAIPKPEPKKKGGKGPRRSGDRVERMVAKNLGGSRTPGSGAIKDSNRNLTGDVEVPDALGRFFLKMEVKASGIISAKGEKNYSLSKKVLDQMFNEAEASKELGMLWIHFKGQNIEDGYGIIQGKHLKELIELAKIGHALKK